jgi:hypothetical protein
MTSPIDSLDSTLAALHAMDPTDLAAVVANLPADHEHLAAIHLGLAIALQRGEGGVEAVDRRRHRRPQRRTRLQDLRDASHDVHGGDVATWAALAHRDRLEAVLARREVAISPVYCAGAAPGGCDARGPGRPAVLHVPHPLPDLRTVRCPACAATAGRRRRRAA